MIVCLDSGNSRLKWGVHDGHAWLEQGAADHGEPRDEALAALVARWPQPRRLLLANVAGPAVAAHIATSLGPWAPLIEEVRSSGQCAGVINHYQPPERLGVDRWCALIAARQRTQAPCLVVMAGTATTIDSLDADGNFCGGLILPGYDLMRRALASDTASLPLAPGEWTASPRRTEDAIATGIIEAQAGAIDRAFARLADPAAICLLSGGNAGVLRHHLDIPCVEISNLPLEGLLRMARDAGGDS
ncbi:MAG: type III pantothenate kinase [Betaproteobacteria bacterium]|nr:type III pantothenate kinase [Betaproteobacteria bacterium]MCL2886821.1 type III pantothenate kinase [Betaproteobacteria bacterium]